MVVSPLVATIKVTGTPDGAPGDRVVNLQFLRKSTGTRAHVVVNLTRATVRNPDAP